MGVINIFTLSQHRFARAFSSLIRRTRCWNTERWSRMMVKALSTLMIPTLIAMSARTTPLFLHHCWQIIFRPFFKRLRTMISLNPGFTKACISHLYCVVKWQVLLERASRRACEGSLEERGLFVQGIFLIPHDRWLLLSSHPGCFAISWVSSSDSIRHNLIYNQFPGFSLRKSPLENVFIWHCVASWSHRNVIPP